MNNRANLIADLNQMAEQISSVATHLEHVQTRMVGLGERAMLLIDAAIEDEALYPSVRTLVLALTRHIGKTHHVLDLRSLVVSFQDLSRIASSPSPACGRGQGEGSLSQPCLRTLGAMLSDLTNRPEAPASECESSASQASNIKEYSHV